MFQRTVEPDTKLAPLITISTGRAPASIDVGLSLLIAGIGFGTTILMERAFVANPDALSVTRAVKLKKPAVEGVPLRMPLEEARERPGGRDPAATAQA